MTSLILLITLGKLVILILVYGLWFQSQHFPSEVFSPNPRSQCFPLPCSVATFLWSSVFLPLFWLLGSGLEVSFGWLPLDLGTKIIGKRWWQCQPWGTRSLVDTCGQGKTCRSLWKETGKQMQNNNNTFHLYFSPFTYIIFHSVGHTYSDMENGVVEWPGLRQACSRKASILVWCAALERSSCLVSFINSSSNAYWAPTMC